MLFMSETYSLQVFLHNSHFAYTWPWEFNL